MPFLTKHLISKCSYSYIKRLATSFVKKNSKTTKTQEHITKVVRQLHGTNTRLYKSKPMKYKAYFFYNLIIFL